MRYLCELSTRHDTVKAYLPEKDAIVGRFVKLKNSSKTWVVESIEQKIEDDYAIDNKADYEIITS